MARANVVLERGLLWTMERPFGGGNVGWLRVRVGESHELQQTVRNYDQESCACLLALSLSLCISTPS